MKYNDDTLIEFLNGTLAEDDARTIEIALVTDAELGERIMALDTFAAPVREVMETIPSQERIERLQAELLAATAPIVAPKSGWGFQKMAASIALGLIAGWSANAYLTTPEPTKPSWRMEVANYQALYVPETVAHLKIDPDALKNQFERASNAVNLDLPQDALDNVADLTLARAQVLGFFGKPLIQIAYKDAKGMPIALCIIAKPNVAPKDSTKFEVLQGMASATWETATHQFLLIGNSEQENIKDWSGVMQKAFTEV